MISQSKYPEWVNRWPIDDWEFRIRRRRVQSQGEPKTHGNSPYAIYLGSEQWRKFRENVLIMADCVCFDCKGTATEVHHTTYERRGRERLSDVVPLCRHCHEQRHGGLLAGQ